MIKKSFRNACHMSVSVTIGVFIVRTFIYPKLYNFTVRSWIKSVFIYWCTSFVVLFLIELLIAWIKSKLREDE